jgi:hypothetical protein
MSSLALQLVGNEVGEKRQRIFSCAIAKSFIGRVGGVMNARVRSEVRETCRLAKPLFIGLARWWVAFLRGRCRVREVFAARAKIFRATSSPQ